MLIKELSENEIAIFSACEVFFPRVVKHLQIALAFQSSMHGCSVVSPIGINACLADLVCGSRIGFHCKRHEEEIVQCLVTLSFPQ